MKILLNTRLRRKLLAYSFTHVDESYYVRELAGFINEDPGNLSRELRKLSREGLYQSVSRGNLKLYCLNKDHPLFKELKAIVFKTEGVAGRLKEIALKQPGIALGFIYGSYAKNKEKAASDIDLVVVGTGDFNRDVFGEQVRRLEADIDREINFNIYTEEEFKKESKKRGSFLNLVIEDKIVMLKGKI